MRKLFSSALALAALLVGTNLVLAQAPVVVVGDGCQDSCLQKVCKPIQEPKTIIKPVYTDKCIDYCEPRCWTCSLFGSSCDSCGPTHSCGTVKTRKVMIVKLKKCETCVNKCVVEYAPACSAPCTAPCAAPCGMPLVIPAAPPAVGNPQPMPLPVGM